MGTGAIVVIVATSAGFLFLIGAFIWFLTHWDYPKGTRHTFKFVRDDRLTSFPRNVRVDLVVSDDVDLRDWVDPKHVEVSYPRSVAYWCAVALGSANRATKRISVLEKGSWTTVGNRIVVYVVLDVGNDNTDREGDFEIRAWYKPVNKRIPWFSSPIPCAHIEAQTLKRLQNSGEPVIHEIMHGVMTVSRDEADRNHIHQSVWAQNSSDSIQSRAQESFVSMRSRHERSGYPAYK